MNNLPELWNNVYQTESAWQLHPAHESRASANDNVPQAESLHRKSIAGSSSRDVSQLDMLSTEADEVRFDQNNVVKLETLDKVFRDGDFIDDDFIDWDLQ